MKEHIKRGLLAEEGVKVKTKNGHDFIMKVKAYNLEITMMRSNLPLIRTALTTKIHAQLYV
jgi:hypothetical protein